MSAATPDQSSERGVWVTAKQVLLCGCPNVARFLAQCLYWSKTELVMGRQGWFYKSRNEWQAETWLSRYQQERARQWLRGMNLLQERHERRQNGRRWWFRLDRLLLNTLLNNLADQSPIKEIGVTEDCSDSVDARSLTKQSENKTTTVVHNDIVVDESRVIEEKGTIVLNQAYKDSYMGENGTIVSDYNMDNNSVNSDIFCLEEPSENNLSDIAETTETPSVQPEDTQAPLSLPLTCQSDSYSDNAPDHNTTLADYQCCHPFIYQYLSTRLLAGPAAEDWVVAEYRRVGFGDKRVLEGLFAFVDQWGGHIQAYYQNDLKVACPAFSQWDIDVAVFVSGGGS